MVNAADWGFLIGRVFEYYGVKRKASSNANLERGEREKPTRQHLLFAGFDGGEKGVRCVCGITY
jgi:hypothetical protein